MARDQQERGEQKMPTNYIFARACEVEESMKKKEREGEGERKRKKSEAGDGGRMRTTSLEVRDLRGLLHWTGFGGGCTSGEAATQLPAASSCGLTLGGEIGYVIGWKC